MIDKDWTAVLGAQDPEMREIEKVLGAAGVRVLHAARERRRCSAQNAYQADGVVRQGADGVHRVEVLAPKAPALYVECGIEGRPPAARVDHHHPGDPGYEMPPERYLDGSSLGQVLQWLEREPSDTQRLLAAADHCLTAAYQGRCPGVDPGDLLYLRAAWQAKMSGRTVSDVVEGILDAAKRVKRHWDSEFAESRFFDPTQIPRDLPEGGAYAGMPVRYRALLPDGVLKEMIKGADAAHIGRFMNEHEAAGRLTYGNPHRGYAGAYWRDRAPGHMG